MRKYRFEDNNGNPRDFECPARCLRAAIAYGRDAVEEYSDGIDLTIDPLRISIRDDRSKKWVTVGYIELTHDLIAERVQVAQGYPLLVENAFIASVGAVNNKNEKLFRRFTREDALSWFGEGDVVDPRQIALF